MRVPIMWNSILTKKKKLRRKEFQELWSRINTKSAYTVNFDTDELIQKAIGELNRNLRVAQIFVKIESGEMKEIKSREALESGGSFVRIHRPIMR